jgi:hypothetical protein
MQLMRAINLKRLGFAFGVGVLATIAILHFDAGSLLGAIVGIMVSGNVHQPSLVAAWLTDFALCTLIAYALSVLVFPDR